MKTIKHEMNAWHITVTERHYIGNGEYTQSGLCADIEQGDKFWCFTEPKRELTVSEVTKSDAKVCSGFVGETKNLRYDARMKDESYIDGEEYLPLSNIPY